MEAALNDTEMESSTPYEPLHRSGSQELTLQSPKRVLIVDDDYDSIKLLERTLSSLGCYVQIAMDGRQAVELIKDTPYDLVFLDWIMPRMTGDVTIEEADKMLDQEEPNKFWLERKPVVTYSSHDLKELRIPSSRHFAFIDHWQKPMKFDQLHMQVKEVLNYVGLKGH